jgi:hypothetical protein
MKAVYVETIEVTDPDSGGQVSVDIFKDPESGGMFGVDSSFLEQVENKVPSPFNPKTMLELEEE